MSRAIDSNACGDRLAQERRKIKRMCSGGTGFQTAHLAFPLFSEVVMLVSYCLISGIGLSDCRLLGLRKGEETVL